MAGSFGRSASKAGPMKGRGRIVTARTWRFRRRLPETTFDGPPCSSAAGASPTFWFSRTGPITTDRRWGS